MQIEIMMTVLNDQLPFYFFMCQHIRNISDEEDDNDVVVEGPSQEGEKGEK